jgi:hypothetical protein
MNAYPLAEGAIITATSAVFLKPVQRRPVAVRAISI